MKKLLLLLISILILSCANKEEILLQSLTKDTITGEILWNRISTESDYKNYAFMPGQEGLLPGQSPHGVFHKIYVNKPLINGLPSTTGTVPYGSIIVKENYTQDEDLDKLTIMAKIEGYNSEEGDWFWASIKPDGTVLAEGTPAGCLSCHSGVKYNDYIVVRDITD